MFQRSRMVGVAAITALATLHSVPALSNTQTWDFGSSSIVGSAYNNTLSMSQDGINLTVSGWSDTDSGSTIESGRLIWATAGALGIRTQLETDNSPNHAVDSSATNGGGSGYDMLLLEFDTAVELDGIDLAWAWEDGASQADISILAYDSSTGSPGVSGKTWSNVLASNGGGYNSAGNHSNVSTGYYGINTANVSSSRWLVGVYNQAFGQTWTQGNDAFKLASVSAYTSGTNPPTDVPVPATLALFMAGILAMRSRRAPGAEASTR